MLNTAPFTARLDESANDGSDAPANRRPARSAGPTRSRRGLMGTIGLRLSAPLFARRSTRARLADLERRITECNSVRGVDLPATRLPRP